MSKYIKPWCPLPFDLRSTNIPTGPMTSTRRPHVFPRQGCNTAIDELNAQRPYACRIPCVQLNLAVWIDYSTDPVPGYIRCHHAWNSHCWLQSFLCLFWLVFGLVVCFWFVCSFLVLPLRELPTGLCIGPLPALLRLPTNLTALQANYNSAFLLRLNVCNDLAKAMKALDGKKTDPVPGHYQ